MLIKFRVENHRSLRDEQTLSLVAARTGGADDAQLLHPPSLSEALLPAVALYGANASGKTNVLLALAFMRDAVINSHRLWEPGGGVPVEPFALSKHQLQPSLYEVEMLIEGVRYRYGFVLSSERVEEEWLYAWPGTRRQLRFERKADDYEFSRNLGGNVEVIRELTRQNSLFLSAGAQNNNAALLKVFRWFQQISLELPRVFRSMAEEIPLLLMWQLRDDILRHPMSAPPEDQRVERELSMIARLLSAADTGILEFRIRTDSKADRSRELQLEFRHRTDDETRAWLPADAESAGTLRFLVLTTRVVPALRAGGVLCVDEIEASLHPMLAAALLHLFCDPIQNPNGAQLIFTTHDTNLLGNILGFSPLRRDQVWLTEKDEVGVTHLYPLTDFHPRKHENMERGYLQGRYGAVPFLGELLAAPDGIEHP